MTIRTVRSTCTDLKRRTTLVLTSVGPRQPAVCRVTCEACGEEWLGLWSTYRTFDTMPGGQHYTYRELSAAVWALMEKMRLRAAEEHRAIGRRTIDLMAFSPVLSNDSPLPLGYILSRDKALRLYVDHLERLMLAREGNRLLSEI